MPKRGDRAAPPRVGNEYEIRFDSSESAKGWEELARTTPANLRRAYGAIRQGPRAAPPSERHHRLHGTLATVERRGVAHEHWQYEVTGGGRIWYLIDDASRMLDHPRRPRPPEGNRSVEPSQASLRSRAGHLCPEANR